MITQMFRMNSSKWNYAFFSLGQNTYTCTAARVQTRRYKRTTFPQTLFVAFCLRDRFF